MYNYEYMNIFCKYILPFGNNREFASEFFKYIDTLCREEFL